MDSCHIFNFLFGTRKATSELRKCFTRPAANSGRPPKRSPATGAPLSTATGPKAKGPAANQPPQQQQQQQQVDRLEATRHESPAPLKQIQPEITSVVEREPLATASLGPHHQRHDADGGTTFNDEPYLGACGIFEAQLVRLGADDDADEDRTDAINAMNENNNDNGPPPGRRGPLRTIIENPANKLDNLDELSIDSGPQESSQRKINVYDNPLAAAKGPSERPNGLVAPSEVDASGQVAANLGADNKTSTSNDENNNDENNNSNNNNNSERFRSLVQSFEVEVTRQQQQPPPQQKQKQTAETTVEPATNRGLRPAKPPDTPPKSIRARCMHVQLTLRKPTKISSLFQDRAFLEQHFFNKLAPIDRCAAAQVCRKWRNILYADKNYWKDLVGGIDCNQLRREHLAECIMATLQSAKLKQQQQQLLSGSAKGNHQPGGGGLLVGYSHAPPPLAFSNCSSSTNHPSQSNAAPAPHSAGIANSKSSSSQISSSTLSSISISSLLSPLSESSRVDSLREKLYTALDERGFDSICLFGANDDDIDDLASKTRPNGAQRQIKLGRLSNCSITDRGLEVFLTTFSQLEELELTGCNEITNNIDLRGLRQLRRLIITDCINIADGLAQRLIEIVHQLDVLVVQAYHLTDTFLEFVSLNAVTSSLRRLELPNCKEITNSSALTIAKHFQALESLSISGSAKINDDGVEILAERMRCLSSLDLGWLKIGDLSLECLACDQRQLKELILDRNAHITDLGLGYLATMDGLTLLYVRWCSQLTDKSIKSIAAMRSLRRLSLAGLHQITARGILSLIESQQLEELELTNCPAVTCELQQFLSAKMPNCNIIY
jgi:hypothetical protein